MRIKWPSKEYGQVAKCNVNGPGGPWCPCCGMGATGKLSRRLKRRANQRLVRKLAAECGQ